MRELGSLEALIMQHAWDAPRPLSVRDVVDGIDLYRPRAYTTVMTVMDKLYRKGWLRRELVGRAYVYRPAMDREEYAARLMREALDLSRDSRATLLRFAEAMPAEEAALLRAALEGDGGTS